MTVEQLLEAEDVLEAHGRTDDGRHIVEVTLIRSGTSKNGNHYDPEVLREALPLFEGVRAFADHPRPGDLPERSVRDIVGSYRNIREDNGRIRGELHILPGNDWLYHLMCESQDGPQLCGVSIDASGEIDRSSRGIRTVRRISGVHSVDVVTRPSAGGTVDRILQSDRKEEGGLSTTESRPSHEEHTHMPPNQPGADNTTAAHAGIQESQQDAGQQKPAPQPAGGQPGSPVADLAQLVEAQNRELREAREELARVQRILNPAAATQQDESSRVASLVEELKRERDITRCEGTLRVKLAEAHLPEPVERRIAKRFGGRIFEASELDSFIQEEKDTLAALTSAGQVHGMGFEKVSVGMSEYDQLQTAFDGLFDVTESEATRRVPKLSGIREAFRVATGVDIGQIGSADRRLAGPFLEGLQRHVASGNLQESEAILREADVTNATFSYLLGTSMNKKCPSL